jgi:DNA-binding transcriptional ArsR family regulator
MSNSDILIEQFKALAHPLRLRILEALSDGERNVGEIEQTTTIGQPALSQQLGVLRKAGLVDTRKQAKLVYYRLASAQIGALSSALTTLTPANPAAPSPDAHRSAPGVANFARLS